MMLKQIKRNYKQIVFVILLAFATIAVSFAMPSARVWAFFGSCIHGNTEETLDGSVTITKVDEDGNYLSGVKVKLTKETWTGDEDTNGNPILTYDPDNVVEYERIVPENGIVLTPRQETTSDDITYIAALSFGDINTNDSLYITPDNKKNRIGRITIEEIETPDGYETLAKPIIFEYEWRIGPLDQLWQIYSVPDATGQEKDGIFQVDDRQGCDYPLKIIWNNDDENVQFSTQKGDRPP